ncbi:PorP/SprF family type IX secretion system membrane protein [Aquimarina mytili]|uniref:PorP/SprF family type IX secretion system membrane protein n=1 Tax=Aquimarina mytili TaxID=874423 RepID=A0A937D6R1_9FLAO|nr:PorP/SprF family type IX secretion system membrane protein [Aquimarina mytili]MBL0684699.1 PorP/SprF family type IX secretion system membrane protein [Aquimarina mytili]
MVKRLLLLMICLSFNLAKGQEESATTFGVLPTDIPTHNLVKYNRFYFNPTFSLVHENKKSINVYSKIQWAGFNDNPQTYLINYTSNFDEKMGVSIGLHQQNEGIYRYFGGTANYSYNVELDRDMNLTFGMNLSYSQSAIKSNIDAAQNTLNNGEIVVSDDVILNYQNSSVFVLTPGINFNYAEFDVGVSVINLAAYNLTGSELLTDNMAFNGHVMYTRDLERRSDKTVRGMLYATMLPESDSETQLETDSSLRYGGNVILELPELGWAQAGYNSFYGVSLGIGGNINSNVSIGYTYEMGLGDTSDFGSTHEVGLAYNFERERPRRRRSSGTKSSTQKAYEARDSEIRRLKKEILEQNKIIRELQDEQGESQSDAQRAMSELERSIAEAKSEEAKAARELELQREEEVKLLNKQAEEEERLRAQMKLEAEMAEKQAEEERLAAEKKLQQELAEQKAAGQKTEEERIAAEEAIREAEAAKEQAEEEAKLAAQKQLEIEEAQKQAEEDRLAAQRETERIEAERKAEQERLAAQKEVERVEQENKLKSDKLLTSTKTVIKDGSVDALRSQAELIRSSTFIPTEDQEDILSEIDAAIAAKEAEAARLAEEQRLAAEAEAARLAEEERLRQEAEAARLAEEQRLAAEAEAARLAEEERQRQEAEAARLAEEQRLAAEAEAARQAEEARKIEELISATRAVIASGGVNELKSQADIVRASEILPQADKQSLLSELETTVAAKEAEAARLAEEQRLAAEAEAARLAEEERLRQEAEAARLAEEQRLAAEAEAARLAEEERQRQEAEAARLAEEQRLAAEAEAARQAEEERKRQEAAAAAAAQDKEEGLDEIKKELDNNSRVSNKIFARRDSLLTTSLNVDKRGFSKLLESLVNMGDDADEAKSSDPTSSKKLTANNRFIKFADATRPEAQIATKFIPGYPEGYYLIGNVFKGGEYANKFTSTLKDLGFNDSQIILNPENQFQYVSIESYSNKDEAIQKYLSSIDNRYYGDMWILHIAKSRVESYKKLLQETRLITDTVKDDTVLTETLSYIGGHNIENGYYLITNIFKRENYFERGMEKLKSQGLQPEYFRNPKDNYIYVYLKRFDNLDEAKQSLFSNVNNSYNGDLYILKIQ